MSQKTINPNRFPDDKKRTAAIESIHLSAMFAEEEFEKGKAKFLKNADMNPTYAVEWARTIVDLQHTWELFNKALKWAKSDAWNGDLVDAMALTLEEEEQSLFEGRYVIRSTSLTSVEIGQTKADASTQFVRSNRRNVRGLETLESPY